MVFSVVKIRHVYAVCLQVDMEACRIVSKIFSSPQKAESFCRDIYSKSGTLNGTVRTGKVPKRMGKICTLTRAVKPLPHYNNAPGMRVCSDCWWENVVRLIEEDK
jgi:hypothetical protein